MKQAIKNEPRDYDFTSMFDNLNRTADEALRRMFWFGVLIGVSAAAATIMVALFIAQHLYV